MDNSGTILICSHCLELAQMFWYQRAQLRVLRVLCICDMVRSHTCLRPCDHHPALPQKSKKTKSEAKRIQTVKQHPQWVIYESKWIDNMSCGASPITVGGAQETAGALQKEQQPVPRQQQKRKAKKSVARRRKGSKGMQPPPL
jgi:hypothetical protein